MSHYQLPRLCAVILLERNDKYFFIRRQNTRYKEGFFSLPAGHADEGEFLKETALRETKEETGIEISSDKLELFYVLHRATHQSGQYPYVDIFFRVSNFDGEPTNAEPEKCSETAWLSQEEILTRKDVVPTIKKAFEGKLSGELYGELEDE
ncbi:MAG: NUDIX domain-containing protein [Nanoarchaeota archaeon]|nr:NUDIX domain-containing protein [Nanoarchaeota archaeon]